MTTSAVTNSTNMFYGCTKLVGENGTIYDSSHVDKEYARIDKTGEPGYFTDIKYKGIYLPTGFSKVKGTSLETGLTIQDSKGNQYVWVEVP